MEISLIAADWGTSNRRAFALDGAGRVVAEKSDGQGMLALQPSDFDASFRAFAGDWLTGRPPVLICGMAGSRMGWIEAPYLACPADPKGLARVLTRAPSELSVHIVPGVSFDGAGEPDVMRGEETKVLGLGLDHGVVLSPGTHPKWIFVEGGRIAHFRTYMTGEMFNTLQGAGTLAQLMAAGPFEADAFAQGVKRAKAGADLLHSLFGVRTLGLFARLQGTALRSYLSGLLIGTEIADALLHAPGVLRVTAIGSRELIHHYIMASSHFGLEIEPVAAEALVPAALWRIALDAGLVEQRKV
jgi:2-dehydro-3-deoxygalactonokinase